MFALALLLAGIAFGETTTQPRRYAQKFMQENKDKFQTIESSCQDDDCMVKWTAKPGATIVAPPSRLPADRRNEILSLYARLSAGTATPAEKDRLLLLLIEALGLNR